MTKQEIRADMRRRRRAVPPAERLAAAARVCERLMAMNLSGPIAVYVASADEIDLAAFIDACVLDGVRLAAPRWNGRDYELAALDDCWPGGLVAGPHAIREPPPSAPLVPEKEVAAWIVPGLAYATDGARLGYGGGWYDRLLASARPEARRIGVAYDFQRLDALPAEPHDVRMDAVVSGG